MIVFIIFLAFDPVGFIRSFYVIYEANSVSLTWKRKFEMNFKVLSKLYCVLPRKRMKFGKNARTFVLARYNRIFGVKSEINCVLLRRQRILKNCVLSIFLRYFRTKLLFTKEELNFQSTVFC